VIAWEIHEKGIAKNAKIVTEKSTIRNANVENCVKARMLTLRFPEPPAWDCRRSCLPILVSGTEVIVKLILLNLIFRKKIIGGFSWNQQQLLQRSPQQTQQKI
jgi:hypothetical protein